MMDKALERRRDWQTKSHPRRGQEMGEYSPTTLENISSREETFSHYMQDSNPVPMSRADVPHIRAEMTI
jgi:hypothetical protein